MFVISQSQSYFWPVVVEFPVSGGKFDKQTFDAEFKRISQSRIKELGEEIKSDQATDASLAKEILVGWRGVTDEKGEDLPFSESARDALLDVPLVAGSIVKAFMESISGAKRKN